jgi:hypothetical protein
VAQEERQGAQGFTRRAIQRCPCRQIIAQRAQATAAIRVTRRLGR